MNRSSLYGALALVWIAGCTTSPPPPPVPALGMFEQQGDIGDVGLKGGVVFDAVADSYRITGGGANMWGGADAFHFLWKKVDAGDVSLASRIVWTGQGGNPHRKAGVMIRQSLGPDSPYADLMLHGNGLVSVQYRDLPGGDTHEIQSNIAAPQSIRLEREGDYVYMSVAGTDGQWHHAGGSFRLQLIGPYYIGLAVCAHDNAASETATFSNVAVAPLMHDAQAQPALESTLEVIDLKLGNRRVVYQTSDHIEAPNWSRDGKFFVFNKDGLLYRLPVEGGTPVAINSGPLHKLNNDHGLSPDGTMLMVSDQSEPDNISRVSTLPVAGTDAPKTIVSSVDGPSYWHGWSPDGRTIDFVGKRNGDFDIYSISAKGGRPKRLTTAKGLDDGPDYSPDGKYIYFNSVRSGNMKIWRMRPNGKNQEQVTFGDDMRDWFPHPSPNGKWIVFISFGTDVDPGEHPANKDVTLRIMPADGSTPPRALTKLFGGQGTLNVSSWSPDSTQFAFVSYRLTKP